MASLAVKVMTHEVAQLFGRCWDVTTRLKILNVIFVIIFTKSTDTFKKPFCSNAVSLTSEVGEDVQQEG